MTKIFAFAYLLLLYACGAASNPLAKSIPPAQLDTYDVQIAQAQIAYDTGNIPNALKHAQRAFSLNSFSERAGILLGYAYLGIAGIVPFQVISQMNTPSNANSSTSQTTGNQLSQFSSLIGITDQTLSKLGTLDTSVPAYPVWIPFCANQARQQVSQLLQVNAGILALCKFVDLEVRLPNDPRHACTQIPGKRLFPDQSMFLWATLHLIEAVFFNAIIQYPSTSTSGTSNLEKREQQITSLDLKNFANFPVFQTELLSFSSITERIFPLSSICTPQGPQTQLIGLLNDMTVVSLVFQRLPGIPASFSKSIVQTMAQVIKEGQATSDGTQLKAMKANLTQKISAEIATKLKTLVPSNLTSTQKNSICLAYSSISGNQPDDTNKPSFCD